LMEVTVHDRGGEYFSQDGEAQEEGMLSSSWCASVADVGYKESWIMPNPDY
jgi:hypothetical protein